MLETAKTYGITLIIFFLIDMVWLLVVAKDIYKKYLGYLMSDSPNLVAALIFYLLFIVGLVYFVINPALDKNSLSTAVFSGLLFGLITYATYDLTNLATVKEWPITITIIDLIWGTSLGGLVSTLSFIAVKTLRGM